MSILLEKPRLIISVLLKAMYYHARISYASEWGDVVFNQTRDELIKSVVSPFILGQVAELVLRDRKEFVNMKAVAKLTLYQTSEELPN